jgi:hypothetical protein
MVNKKCNKSDSTMTKLYNPDIKGNWPRFIDQVRQKSSDLSRKWMNIINQTNLSDEQKIDFVTSIEKALSDIPSICSTRHHCLELEGHVGQGVLSKRKQIGDKDHPNTQAVESLKTTKESLTAIINEIKDSAAAPISGMSVLCKDTTKLIDDILVAFGTRIETATKSTAHGIDLERRTEVESTMIATDKLDIKEAIQPNREPITMITTEKPTQANIILDQAAIMKLEALKVQAMDLKKQFIQSGADSDIKISMDGIISGITSAVEKPNLGANLLKFNIKGMASNEDKPDSHFSPVTQLLDPNKELYKTKAGAELFRKTNNLVESLLIIAEGKAQSRAI